MKREEGERDSKMANPRRVLENHRLTPLINLLKKPQAFPLLLSFFLLLTWISLRLQHSSHLVSSSSHPKTRVKSHPDLKIHDDDDKVNLVRFDSSSLSPVRKDDRGWFVDPVILARNYQLNGWSLIDSLSVDFFELLLRLSLGVTLTKP